MLRPLFTLLCTVSLLLGVATVVLSSTGRIIYFGHNPQFSLAAEHGTVHLAAKHGDLLSVPVHVVLLFSLALPIMKLQDGWTRLRRRRADRRILDVKE